MGNYMNKGSVRVGGAVGFRVAFLQQVRAACAYVPMVVTSLCDTVVAHDEIV